MSGTKQRDVPLTEREYGVFQHAYDVFNRELIGKLFGVVLPQLLVTLQRRGNSRGYFSPDRFTSRTGEAVTHELALNPDAFSGRSDEEVLSVLVHEIVHLYQHLHGKPSRKGYHNQEFAELMRRVGLQTSSTGYPGGKETGQGMNHYILVGGPFQVAYQKLAASGFVLNWQSLGNTKSRKKNESKIKYTCETCGQKAWGKPGARYGCRVCDPNGPLKVPEEDDTQE